MSLKIEEKEPRIEILGCKILFFTALFIFRISL